MKLRLLLVPILVMLIFMLSRPAGADTARQVVENLHSTLMSVMKQAGELGYKGRYDRLAPVIKSGFDFTFISRIVAGRYWHNFSEEERGKFVEVFTRLSIATYAGRFDGYSGEYFKMVSAKELRRGRLMIKTVLVKRNRDEVELDYILHNRDNQWLIINVIANGVSDISLKRADYTAFLKKKGFKALLDKLAEKIILEAG